MGKSSQCGRYQLLAEIGHGGMGHVFLAQHQGPGRFRKLVAVKRLRADKRTDPFYQRMLLEEGRIGARLSHPVIVQILDVDEDPHHGPFIAMEYAEGPSLRRLVARLRARAEMDVRPLYLRAIVDVLDALDHAHHAVDLDGTPLSIVHRDVSPQNIQVGYSGHFKLLDFGIAKAADASFSTAAGTIKGKLHHMAPEQLRGDSVDGRTDLFAVGTMLWDALAGRRLWEGLEPAIVLELLSSGRVPPPRSLSPAGMPEIEAICQKALSRDPNERYQRASHMRDDLEQALSFRGILPSRGEVAAAVELEYGSERARVHAVIRDRIEELEMRPSAPPEPIRRASSEPPSYRGHDLRPASREDTPTLAANQGRGPANSNGRLRNDPLPRFY